MYLSKFVFIIMGFLWFFSSCTSNTIYKKPDNLISKNEMIDLLTDIYIANAAYNTPNKQGQRQVNYLTPIFEKYGVDSARYASSNLYYMSRIDEYEKMHKKVQERLQKMKKEKEQKTKQTDSLKVKI